MGTKRPSYAFFDTLSNINMSDRKLQPGGKISRDPSPRPTSIAHSERDRDSTREESQWRDMGGERRDKARYKDMNKLERYYERDRTLTPRQREGEREWRERERRQEDDRGRNGRLLSNVEKESEQEVKRGPKKGDTFPRMRKGGADHGSRMMPTIELAEKREARGQRDRTQRTEADEWEREREREREWKRERYRERDRERSRAKEGVRNQGDMPVEDEKSRQRVRYQESDVGFPDRRREGADLWDIRERDVDRRRDRPRLNMSEREARIPSPQRRRDNEVYTDRKEREKAQRRERTRDTRSEGDSDERDLRRERVRKRERDEVTYQHSRSEGDNKDATGRERDPGRQGYRDEDRHRYRDRDGDRYRRRGDRDRENERYRDEGGRWKERDYKDDRAWTNDSREDDRYRDYRQKRDRERDPRVDNTTGRSSRSQNASPRRVPPRSHSSGEWSSDVDSETRNRRDPDHYEERESRKRDTAEERHKAQRDTESTGGGRQNERQENEMTGSVPEQRRMWLEPQRGKNSIQGFVDRERHTRQKESRRGEEESLEPMSERGTYMRGKEEPEERHSDQSSSRERQGGRNKYRDTEGVSVDEEEEGETWRESGKGGRGQLSDSDGGIERGRWRDAEGEYMTAESDREEEGGSDYWPRSESEGGSEAGWKQHKERMLSGEDGFVTVSSGGDEEDERENGEEEFEDCQEFWEAGDAKKDPSPVGFRGCEGDVEQEEEWTTGKEETVDVEEGGKEQKSKLVFCLIGQTSKSDEVSLSQAHQMGGVGDGSNIDIHLPCSDDSTQQPQDDLHLTLSKKDEYSVINNQDTEREHTAVGETADMRHNPSSELQDARLGQGQESEVANPSSVTGTINRDSQTERLLKEWREKNKQGQREIEQTSPVPSNPYGEFCPQMTYEQIQPILDQINTAAMSPEEVEAIRIRMSGAWSMSDEPKRRSQAPHLKWAKSVVREILGNSEEAVDEPNTDEEVNLPEINRQPEEVAEGPAEIPVVKLTTYEQNSELEMEEEEELEGLRGMGQSQADMHTDQSTAVHVVTSTYTHADTHLDTEGKEDDRMEETTDAYSQLKMSDAGVKMSEDGGAELELTAAEKEASRQDETEMYLSVRNTLYKPSSCPILNYECESDLPSHSGDGKGQEVEDATEETVKDRQVEECEDSAVAVGAEEMVVGSAGEAKRGVDNLKSSCSFRDLGPEVRMRRRGIRKTTERRNGELIEMEEEEGVGRDRRTRIFSLSDDEDGRSRSWGEVDLRNVLCTLERRKRNSKFFNAAQLYQQYSEAAQNIEILRQARSDVISLCEDNTASPAPSPPPARRPLPPLPAIPHPHSLSHTGSVTSVKSLPLPEPPRNEGRPSSPRLSISLSQSSTLWRDLPGVRNSTELEEISEDQRRLQEVRFEVVTSEASYCRSLDIVVEHFVMNKQLGSLLTTQDKNWLFSRLADVRAVSHSLLTKLEERVESDIMHFTVCDIIARHCQRFRLVYVPYLTNQSYQDATYQRLMNENPGFKRTVDALEKSHVCQRLPLRSFLVLPFQRITRIKLLVQNIVKRTAPGTPEAVQAIKALKLLEKLIQESNDSISQMKNIESLVSLSAKVDFECKTLPLISQSRRLVREGPVTELMDFSLKDTERNVYLHLFNDYLLLSLQKEGGKFTVINHSPVENLRVENCRVKLHSLQKNLFRLHMARKSLLLRTATQSDKLRWMSALSRPHPEIDFSAAQDFPQMQCIRAFVAQQPDELSLEKAEVILVHQESSGQDDNWAEGTRLSDGHRGWVPKSHLENISSSRVRQRNLSDAVKLTTATAALSGEGSEMD
ncbi:zinc finger CCCH domain-containing protein 13 isoform X1 [Mugil cephalus]|uniref:zinc finger CCCH domain-containing protein 13 isoform X1 n=1 Tax=Mugil cephalus TaxID=48193 RepID=UPI001FB7EF86|nr:zinc finger CCCH domain-containing protein 13 isoform X1 [Mugil cephalus]